MVNVLTLPIFTDVILPFLLIFTLIFAILEKSKLLGDNKSQIDAIIAFVIAGILISFANAVGIITKMTVFMAVAIFVLFVFMLIYAFAYGNKTGDPLSGGLKAFIAVIVFIAVVIAMLFITGYWDKVFTFFTSNNIGINIIFILLIAAAVYAVLKGGKPE
jgi:ABC-type uncharacterized transport system permease subunit